METVARFVKVDTRRWITNDLAEQCVQIHHGNTKYTTFGITTTLSQKFHLSQQITHRRTSICHTFYKQLGWEECNGDLVSYETIVYHTN